MTGERRIGVISDVHSNIFALREVMAQLEKEKVAEIYCAGDIIGYNASANEVVWELRRRGVRCIRGNHDTSLFSMDEDEKMNVMAALSLKYTRQVLKRENASFLNSLPQELRGSDISVFHGSPWDPDEYLYEEMIDESITKSCPSHLIILGHTHVPFVKRVGPAVVLNPGSVGQPRDGDPRASFAIVGQEAEVRRISYDIEAQIEENRKAGLHSAVSERLRWGV